MFSDHTKTTFFFMKYRLLKPRSIKAYRTLLRQQALSRDEIESLNWSKRKRLIRFAFENVPFYRERFKDFGLHPDDLKCPEDFTLLPFLTKQDLREHFEDIVSKVSLKKNCGLATTGGSTGTPVKVYQDRRVSVDAMMWRLLSWWGLSAAVDTARVWRIPSEIRDARWKQNFKWWPTSLLLLDAARMSNNTIESFLAEFIRIKPKILYGYVGALDHLAAYVEEHDVQVCSPLLIWATSAPITSFQRDRLNRVFQSPVCDEYGSCEIMRMAAQCPQQRGMHMMHDSRHIEFIDGDNKPCSLGQCGDIAVTDLENYVFPLIRYRIGDRGRALSGQCSCGVNLPLMDSVKGRTTDNLPLPDGSVLSGEYLTTIFDDFPDAVHAFAVHQTKDYSIDVSYVPNSSSIGEGDTISTVRRRMEVVTQGQVRIGFKAVKTIPHDRGKTHFISRDK